MGRLSMQFLQVVKKIAKTTLLVATVIIAITGFSIISFVIWIYLVSFYLSLIN